MKKEFLLITFLLFCYSLLAQGPYAKPAGQLGSTAIHKDSLIIVDWATNATIERGWQDITDTLLGKTTAGNSTSATDKSGVNGVVSLGDGGIATLTFAGKIYDGIGADFAVFENAFNDSFLELAVVEVSSDGINFFRFDAVSLTDTSSQTGGFGSTDATNLYNLAGKYRAQYGTPFDLNELAGTPGLDVNLISHIRVIDVVGNVSPSYATFDSQNNVINDPFPTPFATGGFDLDGIGVMYLTTTGVNELNQKIANTYPNPVINKLTIDLINQQSTTFTIVNLNGQQIKTGQLTQTETNIDLSDFPPGIYFLQLANKNAFNTIKIIKQ